MVVISTQSIQSAAVHRERERESARGRLLATKHRAWNMTMYAFKCMQEWKFMPTHSHTSIAQWKWNSWSLMSIRKTYLWPFFGGCKFSKRLNSLEEFYAAPHRLPLVRITRIWECIPAYRIRFGLVGPLHQHFVQILWALRCCRVCLRPFL